MKKNCLIALSIFGFGFMPQVYGQFSFGFKISPNFSWVKVQDGALENNGLGLGFSYGLTGDYSLSKSQNYWLTADLLISTAPVKLKHTGELIGTSPTNAGQDITYKEVEFDYSNQLLQIPISVKFKTDEIGGLKYYFQAGLAPSFSIQRKLKTTADPDIYSSTNITSHDPNSTENSRFDFDGGVSKNKDFLFLDDIYSARMSLILGAGVEYPLSGNLNLVGGLRFDNGFTDFLQDNNYKGRLNFLSLHVGLMF